MLTVPFTTRAAGSGRVQFRAADLTPLPAPAVAAPAGPADPLAALLTPHTPGMEVNLRLSRQDDVCYVLRWETLPRNRDRPRATIPPPTELRVFEFSDPKHELTLPAAVGS